MKKLLFAVAFLGFLFLGIVEAAPAIQQSTVDLLKPKLNSDLIEYFFGNYAVDTLEIDSDVFPHSRIANLHSVQNGKKVMRTLAIVDFCAPIPAILSAVHAKILEGKSIGIALREDGWTIHKNPVYFGTILLSPEVMNWMEEYESDHAAVHMYHLEVSKGEFEKIDYCTILEIHSPQYLSTEWLKALYDSQYAEYSKRSNRVDDFLMRLAILMDEFPKK